MDKEVEISSEDNVNNNTDLSLFVHKVIKHDENVSNVEVNDDDVSVEYKTNIKLFGFLPWTTYATTTVNSKGETTIDYPWYAMFASTDEVNLQSQVKTSARPYVNTEAKENTKLSASAKAQILAKIHAAMKADFEASLK